MPAMSFGLGARPQDSPKAKEKQPQEVTNKNDDPFRANPNVHLVKQT